MSIIFLYEDNARNLAIPYRTNAIYPAISHRINSTTRVKLRAIVLKSKKS